MHCLHFYTFEMPSLTKGDSALGKGIESNLESTRFPRFLLDFEILSAPEDASDLQERLSPASLLVSFTQAVF